MIKSKIKIPGNIPGDGNTKNIEVAVPLKCFVELKIFVKLLKKP